MFTMRDWNIIQSKKLKTTTKTAFLILSEKIDGVNKTFLISPYLYK